MAIALVSSELSEEARLADYRAQVVNFKLDSAYVTGQNGTAGVAAKLGFQHIVALIPLSHGGIMWDYDGGTDKLKLYGQPAAATAGASPELASGNYSAITVRALALGQ